ncbi:hypothetical protein V1478_009844 [Vespula squamosa]|uniref:Uncharacterized protein n=1 Tax=Vespula squamosa TaxID=30214 RepID=A0ABD2AJK4_VESSQ
MVKVSEKVAYRNSFEAHNHCLPFCSNIDRARGSKVTRIGWTRLSETQEEKKKEDEEEEEEEKEEEEEEEEEERAKGIKEGENARRASVPVIKCS